MGAGGRAMASRDPRTDQHLERRDPSQPLSSRSSRGPNINIGPAERWGTAALGSALIAAGVARRSLGGALLGLLGGGLLYRSASGHCSVYAALGKNTGAPRTGMLVERSMTIGRPAEELYRFW